MVGEFQLLVKVYEGGAVSGFMDGMERGDVMEFKHVEQNVKVSEEREDCGGRGREEGRGGGRAESGEEVSRPPADRGTLPPTVLLLLKILPPPSQPSNFLPSLSPFPSSISSPSQRQYPFGRKHIAMIAGGTGITPMVRSRVPSLRAACGLTFSSIKPVFSPLPPSPFSRSKLSTPSSAIPPTPQR